ncbi:flavin reductase family protein [Saccharothrix sp. HUAS TT1]|uniref:flavin reductase family protein n=1 Tax=unclassified Saccharothrix TaxID=2593673 RepID=UPI00345C2178
MNAEAVAFDPATMPAAEVFGLLTATVTPRPIAWTSTVGRDGVLNLAPFSFYTVVSNTPPMLSLTIEDGPNGRVKDTLVNIRDSGEFVVNSVSVDVADRMHRTSLEHAADTDEFEIAGLTPVPSTRVRPPRVAESAIGMECRLRQLLRPGSDTVVIGEVVAVHVAPDLLRAPGRIDLGGLRPLGRVASRFTDVRATFALPLTAP